MWELVAFGTDMHGEAAVRHREYTSSEIKALAWERIPKIQFTDSGHGIVFRSTERRPSKKRPRKTSLNHHISSHLPELVKQVRAERRSS